MAKLVSSRFSVAGAIDEVATAEAKHGVSHTIMVAKRKAGKNITAEIYFILLVVMVLLLLLCREA